MIHKKIIPLLAYLGVVALLVSCAPGSMYDYQPNYQPSGPVQSRGVYVISPSVSTSSEARRVLAREGLYQAYSLNSSAGVLVVVRSGLYNPLLYSYNDLASLERDANSQLNISGRNFHVYLYQRTATGRLSQLDHISYPVQ